MTGTATLIGVPYDAASSFRRGAAEAPRHIREALWSEGGNSWTEALIDLSRKEALRDAGDIAITGNAEDAIDAAVSRLLQAGDAPIALGGDHAVTYPIVRAVRRSHPRLTLLLIDAHPDLYDVFHGSRFSHACPFARIMEEGLVDRLVQVGIRAMNGHQHEQADRFGVEVIDMRAWSAGERPAIDGPVYLSIDLDGLDPAFAPGVSHPEPGGLTVREVLSLVQGLPGPLLAADVVECNPSLDVNGATARVAAKLVKEIAARMQPAV
jgi:arginase